MSEVELVYLLGIIIGLLLAFIIFEIKEMIQEERVK